jgi:hypothetical protein
MDSDSWQLAAGWREREGRLPNLDVDAFRRAGRYLDTAVLVAYVVLSTTPQLELFGELGILRSCIFARQALIKQLYLEVVPTQYEVAVDVNRLET